MSAQPEVVDTTAEDIGTDLAVHDHQPPTTLFHTDDPVEVIERASRAADALKGVLTRQGLTQNIQGKDYVRVEGWTTLGSMLGVVPVCVWTRELTNGWEARVEARTLDGRVIGAAEAQCTKDEKMWAKRDPYALRSMAQTRATSKALRGPLGFIVTLAGYEATPSDEMPTTAAGAAAPVLGREAYEGVVHAFQQAGTPVAALAAHLGIQPDPAAIAAYCSPEAGNLTDDQARDLILWLNDYAPPRDQAA